MTIRVTEFPLHCTSKKFRELGGERIVQTQPLAQSVDLLLSGVDRKESGRWIPGQQQEAVYK